jgi:hypothetical protein
LEDDEEKLYVSASYAERPIHRDDAAVRHPDADRHLVDSPSLPQRLEANGTIGGADMGSTHGSAGTHRDGFVLTQLAAVIAL